MFSPVLIFAQEESRDVLCLKNGSIYRGTIIEQVPNAFYKVEIAKDSVISILAADVEKITKEDIPIRRERHSRVPKPKLDFHYRNKGYFFQGQNNFGSGIGMSIINGYKFGQFGLLGIGIGYDWVGIPIGNYSGYAAGHTFLCFYTMAEIC